MPRYGAYSHACCNADGFDMNSCGTITSGGKVVGGQDVEDDYKWPWVVRNIPLYLHLNNSYLNFIEMIYIVTGGNILPSSRNQGVKRDTTALNLHDIGNYCEYSTINIPVFVRKILGNKSF